MVTARAKVGYVQEALQRVQAVAEVVQRTALKQLSSVVSRCLHAVFQDEAYQFRIDFTRKRERTEAELIFFRDDLELRDPAKEGGIGQVDVAALALRLACLKMAQPAPRLFVAADEPLKNINGEEYQNRVGELLMTLSREMGVQMLFISDDDWLKVGKVIELD
ncbi:MAG: hypothetical protein KGL39_00990 [Patescibacteria group bacterium]|nr:hypothetical protein [Patescibacteria group bacterium]